MTLVATALVFLATCAVKIALERDYQHWGQKVAALLVRLSCRAIRGDGAERWRQEWDAELVEVQRNADGATGLVWALYLPFAAVSLTTRAFLSGLRTPLTPVELATQALASLQLGLLTVMMLGGSRFGAMVAVLVTPAVFALRIVGGSTTPRVRTLSVVVAIAAGLVGTWGGLPVGYAAGVSVGVGVGMFVFLWLSARVTGTYGWHVGGQLNVAVLFGSSAAADAAGMQRVGAFALAFAGLAGLWAPCVLLGWLLTRRIGIRLGAVIGFAAGAALRLAAAHLVFGSNDNLWLEVPLFVGGMACFGYVLGEDLFGRKPCADEADLSGEPV